MTYDIAHLRSTEFSEVTEGKTVYLNNASTGPIPRRALDALHAFNAMRAEPQRITLEHQFGTASRARELVARLINAAPAEIALMVNTSYGINLAARALGLGAGDVVIGCDKEFPANVYPWMALEREGVRFDMVPCRGALPDEDAIVAALDRPGVRALAISWVSFATGYRVDLARLGRECRSRGIYLVVDAIQGVGACALDVRDTLIDVLACGGQKWLLSPWGTGFVYVRDELVRKLEPHAVGWMATSASEDFSRLTDYVRPYVEDARRFEVITLPYQDFASFVVSLELIHELGPRAIETHIAGIIDRAVVWAQSRGDVTLITPAEREKRAGIVAIAPRDALAASARLTSAGVVHSLREGAIRLSPHCFNDWAEMEMALAVLADGG